MQAPLRNVEITPEMREFNREMSRVTVSVEWMFGNITNYFSFIDFKKQMKLHLSPIDKIYFVAALLQNAYTSPVFMGILYLISLTSNHLQFMGISGNAYHSDKGLTVCGGLKAVGR